MVAQEEQHLFAARVQRSSAPLKENGCLFDQIEAEVLQLRQLGELAVLGRAWFRCWT